MQVIPLINTTPRQQITITLDNILYDITLVAVQDCMYATILMNNVTVVSGMRCVPRRPLIPYIYLENGGGNFSFMTANDDNPWWDQFGMTQDLLYASAAELAAARAA